MNIKTLVLSGIVAITASLSINNQSVIAKPDMDWLTTTPAKNDSLLVGTAEGVNLHGTLTINSLRDLVFQGERCKGKGMYRAYHEGTRVTVRDGNNNIIGSGKFLQSKNDTGVFTRTCTFIFSVVNIPKADFYTVEINGKTATYSHEDMMDNNWQALTFHLGSGY